MSYLKGEFELTPDAVTDLVQILRYSAETWGLDQAAKYRDEVFTVLQSLADNP